MLKKVLCFSLIMFFIIFISNISFATDVLMDLDSTTTTTSNQSTSNLNTSVSDVTDDNTIYSSGDTTPDVVDTDTGTLEIPEEATTTSTLEDSTDLSISNMINIILIVVGIVLILLGIAIIIKLK